MKKKKKKKRKSKQPKNRNKNLEEKNLKNHAYANLFPWQYRSKE